jgi:WD40 repeat protein
MWKATCVLALLAATPAAAQNYTVIGVSHGDNLISEIDPISGKVKREFTVMPGEWAGEVHEGCVTADSKTAYVSIPYAKHVVILDLDTFKPKGKIESEYFSRSTTHTQTTSRGGKRESTSTDPHGVALNRDNSKLYITVEFAEVPGVVVYDIKAGRVTKKIDTVISGNWLGVDPRTDKLYLPARNDADKVVVIDTKTDRVIRVVPLQRGSRPAGVDFGGPNGEVWISGDGDGSVTVLDPKTDKVLKVIQPQTKGAGRIAVAPNGRFAAAAHGREVSIIDTGTKEIVSVLVISPEGMAGGHGYPVFSPDSNTLHVMNENSGDLVTFDMRDLKAPGRRSPRIGDSFFGGGVRVLKN